MAADRAGEGAVLGQWTERAACAISRRVQCRRGRLEELAGHSGAGRLERVGLPSGPGPLSSMATRAELEAALGRRSASRRTVNLGRVSTTLHPNPDIHVGKAFTSQQQDRLEDFVTQQLRLYQFYWASVYLDQTASFLAVRDCNRSLLAAKGLDRLRRPWRKLSELCGPGKRWCRKCEGGGGQQWRGRRWVVMAADGRASMRREVRARACACVQAPGQRLVGVATSLHLRVHVTSSMIRL